MYSKVFLFYGYKCILVGDHDDGGNDDDDGGGYGDGDGNGLNDNEWKREIILVTIIGQSFIQFRMHNICICVPL